MYVNDWIPMIGYFSFMLPPIPSKYDILKVALPVNTKVSFGQRLIKQKWKECRRGADSRDPPSLLSGGVEKPKVPLTMIVTKDKAL